MQNVIDTINQTLPTLGPQMRQAAAAILDDPSAVAVESMRTMAARAEVSPPTMLRLAQRVGFESYEAFRDVFKNSVAPTGYGDRATALQETAGTDGVPGLITETARVAIRGIEKFSQRSFARDIERVAQLIIGARRTLVIASGASFGQAVSFQYVCQMAIPGVELINRLGMRPLDGLASATSDDLVLAIATHPYASQTVETVAHAHACSVPIAAITDKHASPIATKAAASIIIDTENPHYFPSMIKLSATLEVLSAAIVVLGGAASVSAIANHERLLRANGCYWNQTDE
ncbi:MAG: MurR/RpiR family transcriptional regulator [Pseudomonadota bacterium]